MPMAWIVDPKREPMIAVDQTGVYYGILAAGRQFVRQGTPGVIISTSSIYGEQAAELHETGVRVRTLTLFYDEWLGAFDLCPVLTIRTDDLDYVHQQKHLDTVIARIQDKLAGKEVMEF